MDFPESIARIGTQKSQLQAVTFDAAGTLLHLSEPVGSTYARIARLFDVRVNPGEIDAAFRATWMETSPPFSPANPQKTETEKSWWKAMVQKTFARCPGGESFAEADPFHLFFEQLFMTFAEPGVWNLDPDAPELLGYLKDHEVALAIISNFDDRLHTILGHLGIADFFDWVVLSGDLKISKPDRRIFDHTLGLLNCPAQDALHVGDDPVCDGHGAEATGMKVFLVGKETRSLRELKEVFACGAKNAG